MIGEVRDDASTRKKRAQDGAYAALCDQVTSSIAHEHGASVDTLCIVAPRTVPKTTSGKIARRRCRDAFLADKLDVAYRSTDGPTTAVVSEQPTSSYEHSGVVADVARALGKVSRRDASSLPSKRPLADLGVDSLISRNSRACWRASSAYRAARRFVVSGRLHVSSSWCVG